ncbi:MAG: hypothetical protein KDJ52_11395 [Anaerolineae bacterium]|nr:hypothetical protein [Anaerolineae bacterium]
MATYTVTLDLPESLYQQLSRRSQQFQHSLEEELLAILTMKMRSSETADHLPSAYSEVIEFLGHGATPQEIAEFRLSATAKARASALLNKNKEGTLTPSEEAELDSYVELEAFIGLLKVQALRQLQGTNPSL